MPVMQWRIKAYSAWQALKYTSAAVFLLAVAINRQSMIEGHYSPPVCQACYSAAKQNPDTFYEFGVCGMRHAPGDGSIEPLPNLMPFMWWGGGGGSGGQPSQYGLPVVSLAGVTLGLVLLPSLLSLCLAFPRLHGGFATPTGSRAESLFALLAISSVALLEWTSNDLFQLYLSDGCYVSAWGRPYLATQSGLIFALFFFVICLEVAWCFEAFDVFVWCITACASLLVAFLAFGIVLGVVNYRVSGERMHLFFNSLLLVSILDIPYCLCGPRLKRRFPFFAWFSSHDGALEDDDAYGYLPVSQEEHDTDNESTVERAEEGADEEAQRER